MATFYRRGKYWRVQTCVKGERQSATFDTKKQCREWADKVEAGELKRTWLHQTLDRYASEESIKHKGERWEVVRIARLKREIPDMQLSDLTPSVITDWRNNRLKTVSNGSVRRDIALFKAVLRIARDEWEYLSHDPFKGVRLPKAPPPRRRGITQDEIDKILEVNKWCGVVESKRDQVSAAFLIGIETAMRASEILSCTTDLDRRVATVSDSKNAESREVPLSKTAVNIFGLVGDFTISPATLSTLFRRTKNEAEIPDLHFHDTRSEGISRLAKKFSVIELARIVGHRDLKSLMYYYNHSAEELAKLLD